MQHVLDELRKSVKYHIRQLEENCQKIKLNEESNALLKEKNEKHREAISEMSHFIESLQQAE
jgi:hypothetical protein